MKKIIKFISCLALGGAFGFGGARLIFWLAYMGKESGTQVSRGHEGMEWGLLLLCISMAFVFMFVCAIIHTILHEAGHLIGGLATGYKLLSFRVFQFMLVKEDDGLRWKRFNISGTMGQCIMIPPTDRRLEDTPYFWYNAGGVMVNLALLVISLMVLRLFSPGMVGMTFWLCMAMVGVYGALVNGIPYSFNGISNDGRNLWLLHRHARNRKYFATMLLVAAEMSKGKRVSETPREWFVDEPLVNPSDYFVMSNRIAYMALEEDLGHYDHAREMAEEMIGFGKKLPQLFALEIGGERVMLELMTLNRKEIVDELWTKPLQAYTKANSKYSPMKLAVLYAYELLQNNNAEVAGKYLQKLQENQQRFSMPGEAITALDICQQITSLHTKNKEA